MLVGYKNNGFDDINIDSLTHQNVLISCLKLMDLQWPNQKRSIHIIGYRVHRDWLVII